MRYTTILAVILAFCVAAIGQTDPIRVETDLVVMNVTVTDRSGVFVKGLEKDDFVVTDNGAKQQIDMFSASDSALSIGIVYDMHDADGQAANVLEALKRFTGRLGPEDEPQEHGDENQSNHAEQVRDRHDPVLEHQGFLSLEMLGQE